MASRLTEQTFHLIERLRLQHMVINDDDGDPYLLRTYLTPHSDWWRKELELPGCFLHYFFRSDHDREVHNHPWDRAVAVILSGGYWEERYDPRTRTTHRKLYKPGMINIITCETFHRVKLVNEEQGCWTLFIVGKRVLADGEWGFMTPDGQGFETQNERDARKKRERGEAAA